MIISEAIERYQFEKEQLKGRLDVRETDRADLATEIECCRVELNDLGKILGELHPNVLDKSRQLDELILQHMVGVLGK